MRVAARALALLLALVSLPALAADVSPWLNDDPPASCQAKSTPQTPQQQQERQGYPGRYCCLHCRPNEAPCGGKCLPAVNGKMAYCKGPPGCACPGKP